MTKSEVLCEIWRGDFIESQHMGHAVVVNAAGQVLDVWGDAEKIILPRSSCKMVQALPLVESGAADAAGLGVDHLALACASHNGAAIHTNRVSRWLDNLALDDGALRCGPQLPRDPEARKHLTCTDATPCQRHNNCSGKHAGFLTLNRHLNGEAEYTDPTHRVQKAVHAAFEDVTGIDSPGHAIDGCSAPNFATSLTGLARAMAFFAGARPDGNTREQAAFRLREAMASYPELVAGEGRACTNLMRAMEGRVVVKTGAEAVFTAILPEQKLGIAIKIDDGASRASEAVIAAILVRLGVLDVKHPATGKYLNTPITNWRGTKCGSIRVATTLQ